MAAQDKSLKTTPGGAPGPQSYDATVIDWVLSTGHNGASDVYVVNQPTQTAIGVADGANVAQGAKTDAKVVDPNVAATEIGLLKGQLQVLNDTLAKLNATLTVSGTVGVNALPALPAGGNNIGDVDVLTLPPLVAGTAIIGKTGIDPAANGVKNVDGTGAELFTVANPAQVKLQSSGATGATAPVNAALVGGKDPTGNLHAHQLNAAKELLTATALQGNAVCTILVPPVTLDFKGKTAGQTFDVPHVATKGSFVTTPGAPGTWTTELTQAEYDPIMDLGGTSASSSTTVTGETRGMVHKIDLLNRLKVLGYIPQSWDGATLQARVKAVVVLYSGYGVGSNASVSTNGAQLKLYHNTSLTWNAIGITLNGATASSASSTPVIDAASASAYIDAAGKMHFLAHSTYPSDGTIASTINTDYISVAVQFYGDYLNNGDALSQGKPGNAAPPFAQQIAGNKAGALTVPAVATAADGMSTSLDGLVTTAVMMGSNGATRDVMRVATVRRNNQASAVSSVVIWVPVTNKKFNVHRLAVAVDTVGRFDIMDGATLWGRLNFGAAGTIVLDFGDGKAGLSAAANNQLSIQAVTGTAAISGIAWGVEE